MIFNPLKEQLHEINKTHDFVKNVLDSNKNLITESIKNLYEDYKYDNEAQSRISTSEHLSIYLKRYQQFYVNLSSDLDYKMYEFETACTNVRSEIKALRMSDSSNTIVSNNNNNFNSNTYLLHNKTDSQLNGYNSSNLINAISANSVTIVNNNHNSSSTNIPASEIPANLNASTPKQTNQIKPAFASSYKISEMSSDNDILHWPSQTMMPDGAGDNVNIYISENTSEKTLEAHKSSANLLPQDLIVQNEIERDKPEVKNKNSLSQYNEKFEGEHNNNNNNILVDNKIEETVQVKNLDETLVVKEQEGADEVYYEEGEESVAENEIEERKDKENRIDSGTNSKNLIDFNDNIIIADLAKEDESVESLEKQTNPTEKSEHENTTANKETHLLTSSNIVAERFNGLSSNTCSGITNLSTKKFQRFQYPKLTPKTLYKCWVTYVDSPLLFWVQLDAATELIKSFEANLNKYYNDEKNSKKTICSVFDMDLLYAAYFEKYNAWYRAKILEVNPEEKKAQILYFDYGNYEEVPFTNLRLLPKKFSLLMGYAYPITLAKAIPAKNRELACWSDRDIKEFWTFLDERELYIESTNSIGINWPISLCKVSVRIEQNKVVDALHYMEKLKRAIKVEETREVIELFKDHMYALNQQYHFIDSDSLLLCNSQSKRSQTLLDNSESNQELSAKTSVEQSKERKASNSNLPSPSDLTKQINARSQSSLATNTSSRPSVKTAPVKEIVRSEKEIEEFVLKLKNKCYSLTAYNLPKKYIKLDSGFQFEFEISNCIDPHNIYINQVDTKNVYVKLGSEINTFYGQNLSALRYFAKKIKYNFLTANNLCIVNDESSSSRFYRGLIRYAPPAAHVNTSLKHLLSEENSDIVVLCIDHGVNVSVARENLYPIFDDFCKVPAKCIFAKYGEIVPTREPTDYEQWSKEAIGFFKEILSDYKLFKGRISHNKVEYVEYGLNQQLNVIIDYVIEDVNYLPLKLELDDRMVEKNLARYKRMLIVDESGDRDLDNLYDGIESISMYNLSAATTTENGEESSRNLDASSEAVNLPDSEDIDMVKEHRICKFILDYPDQKDLSTENNNSNSKLNVPVKQDSIEKNNKNLVKPKQQSKDEGSKTVVKNEIKAVDEAKVVIKKTEEQKPVQKEDNTRVSIASENVKKSSCLENNNNNNNLKVSNTKPCTSRDVIDANPLPPKPKNQSTNANSNKYVEIPELENWDPKREAFSSAKNNYNFNEQSVEARIHGVETKYEKFICRNFLNLGHCKYTNCRYLHKIPDKELVPCLKPTIPIKRHFNAYDEIHIQSGDYILIQLQSFFESNSMLMCKARIVGFFDSNFRLVKKYDHKALTVEMNKYYEVNRHKEKCTHYLEDEIVAARCKHKNSWLRAKILSIQKKGYNVDRTRFKVMYLDFGDEEYLYMSDIYRLNEQFLFDPFLFCIFPICEVDRSSFSMVNNIPFFNNITNSFTFIIAYCYEAQFNKNYSFEVYGKQKLTKTTVLLNEYISNHLNSSKIVSNLK